MRYNGHLSFSTGKSRRHLAASQHDNPPTGQFSGPLSCAATLAKNTSGMESSSKASSRVKRQLIGSQRDGQVTETVTQEHGYRDTEEFHGSEKKCLFTANGDCRRSGSCPMQQTRCESALFTPLQGFPSGFRASGFLSHK